MGLDDAATDRETKTQSGRRLNGSVTGDVTVSIDRPDDVVVHAHAGVTDDDVDESDRAGGGCDPDRATGGSELDRVTEQIPEHLSQPDRIADHAVVGCVER